MFHFTEFASRLSGTTLVYSARFPYSEISGSKVGNHLPEAYRRHPTSFIALISRGIHHLLLKKSWLAINNHYFYLILFCVLPVIKTSYAI